MRIAVVCGPGGACWLSELADDGVGRGPGVRHEDLASAIAAYDRSASVRWVWPQTREIYPALLRAGAQVDRCHDVALVEALLLAREGLGAESASLAASFARLRAAPLTGLGGLASPAVPAATAHGASGAAPVGQQVLFEPPDPLFPDPGAALDALIEVHASQVRRIAADDAPQRFALLAAVESAGALAAADMSFHGLPWRADIHDAMLTGLLGPRPGPGMRPARLAELADRIREAFGGRPVNPDSPAQVLRALSADGVRLPSTRSHVLREVDHPAAPLLLEYKERARLHAAHGWSWLEEWVSGGRFRPEYVVGGVVSGRWATRGGGALQIPRVLRRAVVADPGWVLVVADAAQLEPRVLAALSGDRALAAAAGAGDLYESLAGAFGGDRRKAKVAMLSAMYGGAGGEAGQLLAVLRRRFPLAARYVEEAARAGEEGRVVRSRLGRTCPPPSAAWRGVTAAPDDHGSGDARAARWSRARGRFTRNFVVQASAADWALVLLAGVRRRLASMQIANGPQPGSPPDNASEVRGGPERSGAAAGGAPHLVFFQHDEVVVHSPRELADEVVIAISETAQEAGQLVFGPTAVRFPVTTSVVTCYADAR